MSFSSNNLNQYVSIAESNDEFTPQFDDDGNQTLVKTSTGIWQVAYNGENRPVSWTCGSTNITMKFDRMGRRVEYVETVNGSTNTHHRFVYDGYLCVQCLNGAANNAVELAFGWDPTESVATRPLWIQRVSGTYNFFYFHDGNKNVSDLVSYQTARGVPAHYEYAPFGAVTAATTNTAFTAFNVADTNPYRFSSEYADDALGLVYYNYRHYNPLDGRWCGFDSQNNSLDNLYLFCINQPTILIDNNGNDWWNPFSWGNPDSVERNDDVWNAPDCVRANNCYEYAFDRPGAKTDPNERSSFVNPGQYCRCPCPVRESLTCENVKKAAQNDGMIDTIDDNTCPAGYHLVYLVVDKNGRDYHWYRKDSKPFWYFWRGHRWSHKPGETPVTDKDSNGEYIYDPENAYKAPMPIRCYNRHGRDCLVIIQYENCGYLCAPNK